MTRRAVGAAGLLSLLYGSVLVFLRGRPSLESDAGIFVSIAARLGDGDRLYAEVWDNKPPLFYYSQALANEVVGWRGLFLLDALWLALACFGVWLLLGRVGVSKLNRVIGAALYPLLLSGAWYYAGYAELPALALAPVIAWLCLRRSPIAAGAGLGVVAFLRPDYALIMLALVAVAIVIANERQALAAQVGRLLASLGGAVAALLGLLALRGELSAYIDTARGQTGYPARALELLGEPAGPAGHVKLGLSALSKDAVRPALLILVVIVVVGLVVALVRRTREQPWRARPLDRLAAFFVATALAVVVTLVLTELWDHGLEPIALPGTFAACLLVARLEETSLAGWRMVGAVGATLLVCALAFGGLSVRGPGSPRGGESLAEWWSTPVSANAIALEEATAGTAAEATYARLGPNDDDGQAAFVEADLTCPIFHQYEFSANFDEVLACLRDERPEYVLVGSEFAPKDRPETQQWDSFVAAARKLLLSRYTLVLTRPDPGGVITVWRLR